ncbi:unnamed protein product [Aphanomyces euteiches]
MALQPDFVDGLYRTVLTAVKASNGVPSEEEDFHFQYKFNQDFRRGADDVAGRVTSLLQRIRHANVHTKNDEDVVDFDPLEENGPLTDLVDSLLERASEQIIRFQKGEVDPTPVASSAPTSTPANTAPSTRQVSARPQDSFEDKIDNSEAPFVSKLRTKVHAATDGTSTDADDEEVYHPYRYEITNLKYLPWQLQPTENIPSMIPLDDAIYTYVDTVEALEAMMAMLKEANLIAIDLENHSYHSFQGFLCLMQISTWTHDWLVDTLALRSHLHELNSIFCDPTKLKVLHGADSDIVWLQRDLGLYIVNMFDTGQAARCLEYARFSLAYLLQKHCNITADKQYQLADWRLRPLDDAMIKYAREDTRYLLYIYEVMKAELLQRDAKGHNLLFTTLSRSQALCLSVYEKPKAPTGNDAANVVFKLKSTVGLETVDDGHVNLMEQLMLWRDRLARRVDESTGFVCPNAVLMKILKGLPTTPAALFQLCHPIPPLVRKYAHELTLLLTRQASDDGKTSVNTKEASAPRVEKTTVVSKTKDSSQLDEFKGWQAPATARKPKEATVGAAKGLFEQIGAKDHETIDLLNQVRERFASRVFVIVELAGKENTPAVAPQATPRVPVKEEVKQETPLSLTEKYPKLKKRKAETAPATTATEPSVDGNAATSDFKPFDYAAHASAVSTLDLDQKKAPVERTKRKKGYNPFVAAPDDSSSGSVNQKRGYNAPRSSTFR